MKKFAVGIVSNQVVSNHFAWARNLKNFDTEQEALEAMDKINIQLQEEGNESESVCGPFEIEEGI